MAPTQVAEIFDRLRVLEVQLGQVQVEMRRDRAEFSGKIDHLLTDVSQFHASFTKLFTGNGQPGLITRVRDLEQNESRRMRRTNVLTGMVVASASAILAKIVYDIVYIGPQIMVLIQQLKGGTP